LKRFGDLDVVTVMRDGRVVGERKTSETNAAELARLMVGGMSYSEVEKREATPARSYCGCATSR